MRTGLSRSDILHAAAMAIACFIAYWVAVDGLAPFVARDKDLLGGMGAVIATIFVYRETLVDSEPAGISRLAATCVSFPLGPAYLVFFPPTPPGPPVPPGIGPARLRFPP